MTDPRPEIAIRPIAAGDGAAVYALRQAAIDAGELAGADAHGEADWPAGIVSTGAETLVAVLDDRLVGFGSTSYHLLIVDRAFRHRGIGRSLAAALDEIERSRHGIPFTVWLPERNAGARAFLDAIGYRYHSSHWRFRLPAEVATPLVALPPGFTTRAYHHDDLEPYVALINRAFADHPSPLSVTVDLVRTVHGRPGFDPTTILLITPDEDSQQLVAFARINPGQDAADEPEVAFLGVEPDWQGRGLGRFALAWSIRALRNRGASAIALHVEAANEAATSLYLGTGFVPNQEYRRWAKY